MGCFRQSAELLYSKYQEGSLPPPFLALEIQMGRPLSSTSGYAMLQTVAPNTFECNITISETARGVNATRTLGYSSALRTLTLAIPLIKEVSYMKLKFFAEGRCSHVELSTVFLARQGRAVATPSRRWMDGSITAADSLYLLREEAAYRVA